MGASPLTSPVEAVSRREDRLNRRAGDSCRGEMRAAQRSARMKAAGHASDGLLAFCKSLDMGVAVCGSCAWSNP